MSLPLAFQLAGKGRAAPYPGKSQGKSEGKAKGKTGGTLRYNPEDGTTTTTTRTSWYCSTCVDVQYGNNDICRLCQAPRSQGVAKLEDLENPVEMFLFGHTVEERITTQLRALPWETQKKIIEGGSLKGARDPTAVLVGRLSKLNVPREGDWYCKNCFDLQFAKNDKCRRCDAAKDLVDAGGPPDPTAFLQGYQIEPELEAKWFDLPSEMQKEVIAIGSLHGARDPTAVLEARMNKILAKYGKGGRKGKSQDKMLGINDAGYKDTPQGYGFDGWGSRGFAPQKSGEAWAGFAQMTAMMEQMMGSMKGGKSKGKGSSSDDSWGGSDGGWGSSDGGWGGSDGGWGGSDGGWGGKGKGSDGGW